MEKNQYTIMHEVEERHFWYTGMKQITERLLNKYLPKSKKLKILDAGCGTGGALLFLKKYGETYGVDISEYAIELCKKRGFRNIETGSIDNLHFPDNSFDLITCFDVLGQMEVKNEIKTVQEFYRVLKPKGILLIRVASYNWLYSYHDVAVHTKHRYQLNELKHLLLRANFKALKLTYTNCFLLPFVIFRRIVKHLLIKNIHNDSDVQPVHPILNLLLKIPLYIESFTIPYFNLPFGLSIIAVVSK